MRRRAGGFSLIEVMVALTLGLVVVLGITQIFITAKSTYLSQSASARLQEDARFALSKMIQEIRMVGMFGCLTTDAITYTEPAIAGEFANPIRFVRSADGGTQTLTLISADVGAAGGTPTWTIVTDCVTSARAYRGARVAGSGEIALPVRKLVYTVENNQLMLGAGSAKAVLVDNVDALEISFGVASLASDSAVSHYSSAPNNPATIRSVRLSLTLKDPEARVRNQTYNVVASLRNRLQ
ncbi:prepilin-type N-terminal cleavage/methylation domain-containing protein [Pseudomonas sp. LS1212]|uniref:PilW family protein n=1 Tax=Pseudomonas sp. LS1212 TaxID=2972478 RepID=UPI00215CD5CD|nr:prepilin-type N-terminal cleavage/methylation domain-containing protein [Pseudomonas sp. LS1212]UVJ43356.1 prepilin-type N-terminal cleavage/methylation domain-containing protein [Pseudomonas sp. LS1212]